MPATKSTRRPSWFSRSRLLDRRGPSSRDPRRARPTVERLEVRELLSTLPDLVGFDLRPYGTTYANNYFHVLENNPSWGDQIHLNFNIANLDATPARSQTFNVAFYLSADGVINSADYLLIRYTGFTVPNGGTASIFTNVPISLPASNPVGGAGPYYLGMVIDPENLVAESNEANNSNQGLGKDTDRTAIQPPHIAVSPTALNFGSLVNDGPGGATSTMTFTITDTAAKSILTIPQNGIHLVNGTHFHLGPIISNQLSQAVNVTAGRSLVAANTKETWTVQVIFDPAATGPLTDTLQVQSDDPSQPTINIALSGSGTPVPRVNVTNSLNPTNGELANFGNVGVDGPGGAVGTATVTLKNTGSGPLTIAQNGISRPAGPFRITGIASSTQGTINLASGSKTIAAAGAETWTIGLQFDPLATGLFQQGLTIQSNDPNEPAATVSLLGTGQTPAHLAVDNQMLNFGAVPADGPGKQFATRTVTLSNPGQLPLQVSQNGVTLATGTQYKIAGITSSTQGAVSLASGPQTIAAGGAETWTVSLQFDPAVAGTLTDTLRIASNDAASPVTSVALSGTGLDQPVLSVTPAGPTGLTFGPTLNDGAGGKSATGTIQLVNIGTRPLVVSQNGITVLGGTHFQVAGVVSSVSGTVNLSAGSATLAAMSAETWTVSVRFDPRSIGSLIDTLRVASNDPANPTANVALSGQGVVPTIEAGAPVQPIHVSAGRAYRISWTGGYAPGTGTIAIAYGRDWSGTGLVPIVSGLPQAKTYYDWQVPTSLIGGTFTIYVTMQDGAVKAGDYAAGSLTVDVVNSDRLLSAPVTDQTTYALSFQFNGTTYTSNVPLSPGDNVVYPVTNGVQHEYHVTQVPSLVDSQSTSYDELGNPSGTTDADGQAVSYQYDQLSRLTRVAYPDGATVDYTYDATNNLLSMHDASGWQLYTYDTKNRLTGVAYSPGGQVGDPANLTVGYEYDADGRTTALVYPGGKRVEYGYDVAGRLTAVTEKNAGQPNLVTTYAYNPTTGLLASATRPNDTQTLYTYDPTSGYLTDIRHQRASTGALIVAYHYTPDASGRHKDVTVTTPTGVHAEAYQYDQLNRLVQVTYADGHAPVTATDKVVKYTYDGNGNRLTTATYPNGTGAPPSQVLTYTYGVENRLQAVTDQGGTVVDQYAYDWRGNRVMTVTPTATTRYTYDGRNLLTSVDDGTNHVEYTYDGAGRRVAQTVNGVLTRFVPDPSNRAYQTLEDRDAAGNLTATFTYGLERLSGVLPGQSQPTYYLQDALGSTAALTDAAGADRGDYRYDAFGQVLSGPSGIANPYTFTGEFGDPVTGLVDLRARSYDPQTGTFLSKDPAGLGGGDVNFYRYAGGNPVTYVDATGLADYPTTPEQVQALNNPTTLFITGIKNNLDDAVSKAQAAGFTNILVAAPYYKGPQDPIFGRIDTLIQGAIVLRYAWTGAVPNDITVRKPDGSLVPLKDVQSQVTNVIGLSGGGVVAQNLINNGSLHVDNFFSVESPVAGSNGVTYVNPVGITHQADWAKTVVPWTGILTPDGIPTTVIVNPIGSTSSPRADFNPSGLQGDFGSPQIYNPSQLNPGGVLIDRAATLVGANLKDITGAAFDPVSHQLVFLGNANPATLHNVNLDYFYTAIQSVYGSAVPPYVTLDPPARLVQPSFNLGSGDGVIPNGQTAPIFVHYTPYTPSPAENDNLTLSFAINNAPVTIRINSYIMDGRHGISINAGGRYGMGLTTGTVTGLPTGVSVYMPPIGTLSGFTLNLNAQGQDSYFTLTVTNNSGVTQTVTNIQLVPDLQDRKFGGRVDGTTLGWVMFEADRIAKDLAIGKEQLTGTAYDSHNATLPAGFQNMLERYLAAGQTGQQNTRLWLTPNYETLKRYIDPVTGEATVVFDQSSVKLNTESLLAGKPEDPIARAFVDFFNAHYDQFAALNFPVHDPTDPAGTRVIQVKIFDMLRDGMKAVALARFFHDNAIPLDTWWLNSWTPPKAYIPTAIPTLSNSMSNGTLTLTMYGGVTIKTPNQYLPDDVARIISNAVRSQRTPGTGDLATQSWTVSNTPMGSLNAVAASLAAVKQDADVTLAAADLSFASPGGEKLAFERYDDSAYLGNQNLGLGWQPFRYDLQFQYPTYVDDYGLLRDGSGKQVPVSGAASDTQLRSGEIRLVDHSTGQVLNFFSSLTTAYSLDNNGNPILQTSGLTSNDVPTFTPGQYKDGTTLVQDPQTKNYILTGPDGSKLVFDAAGRLLTLTDRLGNTITYTYTNGQLTKISDGANQALTITYGSDGRIQYVAGPDTSATPMRRTAYTYDAGGRLIRVDTQALQSGGSYATARSVQYQYNASNQLTGVIGPDGITSLTNAPDLRGRSTMRQDPRGNMADYAFTQDPTTNARTTQIVDMGTTGLNNPTAHGTDALRYFAAGSTSMTQFDGSDRTTKTMDPLGHATTYGYNGSSLLPNSVTLPTPGRPSISIQRNAVNLPTVINDPANTGGTPVQITYNAANLPTQVTDAKGRVTQYTYTAWNDIQTVTVNFGTPLAATTTYNYNTQKLLDNVVDPLGKTVVRYGYDALGRITSVTDGTGVVTSYTYDAVGRLKRVYDPRLTGTVKYVEYTYNDNDQVTQVATPTGNITYQYDPATHRLTSTTDLNGNTTQYAYDPATGALVSTTQVATGGNAVTQAMYDRLGNLTLLTAPNGNRTAFRYDALGRPTAMIEDGLANPAAAANVQTTAPGAVRVAVTASEPVLVATLTYWIDGQPRSSGTAQAVRLNDLKAFSFDVTGLDPRQVYRYDLTLTDGVGRTQTLPSRLLTLAPTLTPPSPVEGTALNNVTVATFAAGDASAQPADFTATITWGDGGTSPGTVSVLSGTTFKVTGSHTYADEAAGLTFRVQISGVSSASVSGTVTAADAPLTASAVTITPVERVAFAGTVATFRDANPQGRASEFSATIDWGDGTALDTTSAVIAPDAQGGFTVAGRHTFATSGSYTVRVTVRDVGGSTAAVNSTAAVAVAADLGVTQGVDNASPVEGSTVRFTITVNNATGPHAATGVRLTDVLPTGLVFVSATPSAGTYNNSTGVWTVGNLAVGGSATLQLTATVAYGAAGRSLTNTAAVSQLDQVDPNLANNSAGVTVMVQPAAATSLTVAGFPAAVMAGVPGMVTVTARDPNGMPVAGYRGTVHFRSSDPAAVLPADYTFTTADAGSHTFTLTLKTAGSQSVTAADTTTGTLTGTQSGIMVSPAAASTLLVAGFPAAVMAGVPGLVTVTAKDPYGNVATGYTGTVRFSSTDPQAMLPGVYQFTATDNGVHTFGATLKTAGTQSLTAADTTTGTITGTQTGIVVSAAAASTFVVSGFPATITAGVAGNLTVTAQDLYGNVAASYTGTVRFSSSDGQATLPGVYSFTAADRGVHTFSTTLKTAATQSLTATDTTTASITGTQAGIVVTPAAAGTLVLAGFPSPSVAGVAGNLMVTARDPYGNTASGYRGTVRFSSTDPQAMLPGVYPFTATDNGVHTFSAALKTAGTQALTATDTTTGSITGTQSGVVVNAAAASTLVVAGFPASITAGVAGMVTVTALDPYGNTAVGYRGTVRFTSSDGQAVLPADYPFTPADNGTHAFGATLKTAGTRSLTATDTATGAITGTQAGITVTPAAAASFRLTPAANPVDAGAAFNLTVTALDAFANVATGYTGTVHFTSSDGQAVLPANYAFTAADNGTHPFGVTLKTAGTQTVTATDTQAGGLTGVASVTVRPAPVQALRITGVPASTTAGVAFSLTVAAVDAYGNTATGYTGTVHFTSGDGQARLPADYSFTAADQGVHTFANVSLATAGSQSITATETQAGSITGTATATVTPAAVDHFRVATSVTTAVAGTAFDVTVTAQDAYNNTATGYTGTVTFTSQDPYGASLPPSYTFTGTDAGVHTFAAGATLYTAGPWDVTATDPTTGLTGTTTVTVTPAAAVQLRVTTSADGSGTVAGSAFDVTVTALDPYGNTDVNYAGTVTFTSADPYGATLPADYTFQPTDQGRALFPGGATLYTSGAWDVTATDTASGITGSAAVTVTPAAAVRFQVIAPSGVAPNTPFDVTVIALDPYGNTDVNYQGTVTFTSTDQDPGVVLPADYTFTTADAGMHTFTAGVTLVTPGDQTVTVTDSGSGITGSATVTVDPGGMPGLPENGSRRARWEVLAAAATRHHERGGSAAEAVDWVFADPDGDPWLPAV